MEACQPSSPRSSDAISNGFGTVVAGPSQLWHGSWHGSRTRLGSLAEADGIHPRRCHVGPHGRAGAGRHNRRHDPGWGPPGSGPACGQNSAAGGQSDTGAPVAFSRRRYRRHSGSIRDPGDAGGPPGPGIVGYHGAVAAMEWVQSRRELPGGIRHLICPPEPWHIIRKPEQTPQERRGWQITASLGFTELTPPATQLGCVLGVVPL